MLSGRTIGAAGVMSRHSGYVVLRRSFGITMQTEIPFMSGEALNQGVILTPLISGWEALPLRIQVAAMVYYIFA